MTDKTYDELVQETLDKCNAIADYPEQRLQIREAFYKKFGYVEQDGHNYGRSEIAFLEWEIKRGVLNPLDDTTQPGSSWWRNVNLHFIFLSELAGAMKENNVTNPDAPMPTLKWLDYINNPTPETWYKAHNSTILDGFQRYQGCAHSENKVEKIFLNITLYRLLFAQAMVEKVTIFPEIAEKVADPRGLGVTLLTKLPDFYPTNYPLNPEDLCVIEGVTGTIEDDLVFILDGYIRLHLAKLYKAAEEWNDSPFLDKYIQTVDVFGLTVSRPIYARQLFPPTKCDQTIGIAP